MELKKSKNSQILCIKSLTWYKDSHSLFDYEANKVEPKMFNFPANTKSVTFYRKKQSSVVIALDQSSELSKHDLDQFQFLTHFDIKQNPSTNKLKLEFSDGPRSKSKKINSQRLNTDQSISSYKNKEEETFLIVRKIKDINSQQKGYKLVPGQILKLGRVEYFVSEVRQGNNVLFAKSKPESTGAIYNRTVMKLDPAERFKQKQKNACKICLEEIQSPQNFLFNPCKCSGSCGTVHYECLAQWIHFKVKKEVIGGTLHFNFNKFQCEVCKYQLPMIIDVKGVHHELLPIQKPQGNYLILEGANEKIKSVMIIKNVPVTGIKLGRGHECEIRITDISVSRNHAQIKNVGNSFYVFDNKSKFGTLIKDQKMSLQIGKLPRGVQIGRTTLNFQLKKQSSRDVKTEHSNRLKINE